MISYPKRRLGDVIQPAGRAVEVADSDQYPIVGIYSFGKGLFHRPTIAGSETSYHRLAPLRTGQLVMSKLNAWEGALAVVESGFEGSFVSPEYPVFDIDQTEVTPGYIRYLVRWPRVWGQLTPRGSMVRRKRTNPSTLMQLEVPLPNLEEQRRIVDRLDVSSAASSQLVAHTQQYGLDSIPLLAISGMDKILRRRADNSLKVGEACDLINDTVHPGGDLGLAREFIGLEHISPHLGLRLGGRPVGDESGRKLRFAPEDVLYGYLRPYLNKVWVADCHGLCSVEQYVLRPNGVLLPRLIAYGLRSRSTLDYVNNLTNNLQLPRLRSALLLDAEIPFIREEQQEAALAELDSYMNRITKVAELQRHRDGLRTALWPSILNAAFDGEL